MNQLEILKEFEEAGNQASFHLACDYGNEWRLAKQHQETCYRLYKDNPELNEEMKALAKDFLWGYEFMRSTETV